jgi:5S rRNA maturation endonuclease (ribonuclease M5)
MAENLVIVESPAKARTIKKYLGKDYEVLASYGHVRDLVPKEGAVDPDNNFAMTYRLIERNEKHVAAISKALKKSSALILATDPDREGEAIAWHLYEILKERGELKGKTAQRVVFHEITKNAIREAVASPRELSLDLVNAQQARRALDYLVGFNLSPLLWKKVRRGLSAGRVQSPALRMIRNTGPSTPRASTAARDSRSSWWNSPAPRSSSSASAMKPQRAPPNPPCGPRPANRPGSGCWRSTASSAVAIPRRPLPPRRCSRKLRASSVFPHSAPCASRSSSMRAWISARAALASSATCVPIPCHWPPKP